MCVQAFGPLALGSSAGTRKRLHVCYKLALRASHLGCMGVQTPEQNPAVYL
jgi:hypothetical protein